MLGPYYYFGNFTKSVRYAGWTSQFKKRYDNSGNLITNQNGLWTKGAIIRFITFEGKQKALLNKPTDYYDITTLTQARLKDKDPKKVYNETMVNKLHDHWIMDFK